MILGDGNNSVSFIKCKMFYIIFKNGQLFFINYSQQNTHAKYLQVFFGHPYRIDGDTSFRF